MELTYVCSAVLNSLGTPKKWGGSAFREVTGDTQALKVQTVHLSAGGTRCSGGNEAVCEEDWGPVAPCVSQL